MSGGEPHAPERTRVLRWVTAGIGIALAVPAESQAQAPSVPEEVRTLCRRRLGGCETSGFRSSTRCSRGIRWCPGSGTSKPARPTLPAQAFPQDCETNSSRFLRPPWPSQPARVRPRLASDTSAWIATTPRCATAWAWRVRRASTTRPQLRLIRASPEPCGRWRVVAMAAFADPIPEIRVDRKWWPGWRGRSLPWRPSFTSSFPVQRPPTRDTGPLRKRARLLGAIPPGDSPRPRHTHPESGGVVGQGSRTCHCGCSSRRGAGAPPPRHETELGRSSSPGSGGVPVWRILRRVGAVR